MRERVLVTLICLAFIVGLSTVWINLPSQPEKTTIQERIVYINKTEETVKTRIPAYVDLTVLKVEKDRTYCLTKKGDVVELLFTVEANNGTVIDVFFNEKGVDVVLKGRK